MVKAYILIEMIAGHAGNLARMLADRPEVIDVRRVTGPYDVIAVVQAEDLNRINDFVTDEIHRVEGVVRTTTCVSLEQ